MKYRLKTLMLVVTIICVTLGLITQRPYPYRLATAPILQIMSPGWGTCRRCGWPWKWCRYHLTPEDAESGGCFVLCDKCWVVLTPEQRAPYYETLLRNWTTGPYPIAQDRVERIRQAVREGY